MSLWDFLVAVGMANLLAFGNGGAMFALLQRSLVQDSGAVTNDQLLYAFALARVTPGQANLYVASLGYMLFGMSGAVLSIVAIASPAYLMLPAMRGYQAFQGNRAVRGAVRGLACTSVGILLATTLNLSRDALTTPVAWIVFATALVLLQLTRLPTLVSLLAATALGVVVFLGTGAPG